jgi:hypothetical protein
LMIENSVYFRTPNLPGGTNGVSNECQSNTDAELFGVTQAAQVEGGRGRDTAIW